MLIVIAPVFTEKFDEAVRKVTAVERIQSTEVTPSLLPMLGVTPAIGRAFVAGDEEPGQTRVILISHGLWQQRFGGRADIVGQTLRLNSTTHTIVGVMPADFAFPDKVTRAWTPFKVEPVVTPGTPGFSISMFQAIGRLREGATTEQQRK